MTGSQVFFGFYYVRRTTHDVVIAQRSSGAQVRSLLLSRGFLLGRFRLRRSDGLWKTYGAKTTACLPKSSK